MKVYEYPSYEAYVAAQNEANAEKISNVWVMRETIEEIWRRVKYPVRRILCHGTRNGAEQKLLQHFFPTANIIGTEIADTAGQFQNTVQHDFHKPRAEWLGRFDIVYTNSWDHAYDPRLALQTWHRQLACGRCLFLEHAPDNVARPWDPVEISGPEIVAMLQEEGYLVRGQFNSRGCGKHPSVIYIAERPEWKPE